MRAFVKNHPLGAYFFLALGISWIGIGLLMVRHGVPATPVESDEYGGDAYLPMLLGPAVAGLLLIGIVNGRAGLRGLWSRLGCWRVSGRWWAMATLTVPLTALATLLPMWAISSQLRPEVLATSDNKAAFLAMGIVGGLLVGLFEEVGWTGFATPRLRLRHGVLATGSLLGLVWGVWHLPLFVWDSGNTSGNFDIALLLPAFLFCLLILPLARVLMVWLYEHTRSLLLATAMHASVTGVVAMILIPLDAAGWPLTAWYLAFAAVLAGLVMATIVKSRSTLGSHDQVHSASLPPSPRPTNPILSGGRQHAPQA